MKPEFQLEGFPEKTIKEQRHGYAPCRRFQLRVPSLFDQAGLRWSLIISCQFLGALVGRPPPPPPGFLVGRGF